MNRELADAQINDLLSENERVRHERDAALREVKSLREQAMDSVEGKLLLSSARIIADLVFKGHASDDDRQAQEHQVRDLNEMRMQAMQRSFSAPKPLPGMTGARPGRSKENGTHAHTDG